jgi:hypothetical protein
VIHAQVHELEGALDLGLYRFGAEIIRCVLIGRSPSRSKDITPELLGSLATAGGQTAKGQQ